METQTDPAAPQLAQALSDIQALKQALAESDSARAAAEQRAEQALHRADSAQRELEQFVYAASHDLQEPLRSISSYTQLLQRQFASTPGSSELMFFILDGAARMTTLIRELLNYSRTTSGLNPTTLSLAAPVHAALFKLQSLVRESGAQVRVGDLPSVSADEPRMTVLFEHLIANAIKYHGNTAPEITISSVEGDDAHIVSIIDNGPGIEARFHNEVFVPFKRLHGKDIPGSGLGLAICRKIVEAHGGKIWIESDGHHGTTVSFTLPF